MYTDPTFLAGMAVVLLASLIAFLAARGES